jgi:hypothetical protein
VKLCVLVVLIVSLARVAMAAAGEWKPAKSPLMTKWAKDVSPTNVHPEYPRPQMVRKYWQNLNGLWQFASQDDVKDAPVGKELPGEILVPFAMESALSGVGKHHDMSWYRRTFDVPADWKDQRVLLHFGAVDFESTVWVNGKEMGAHKGGYDSFSFDITDAIKKDGKQEVIVGVTDVTAQTQARGKQTTEPKGIWYTPCSGIWQTVWIEPVPKDGIKSIKITPDVDAGGVRVEVEGGSDARVGVLDGNEMLAIGKSGELIKLEKPKLWSPEKPFLYNLKISAGDDDVQSYFGMRKIEVSPDEKGVPRIKLNGKEIMQVGPLDQGFWPDGIYTAPTDEAMKYDLDVTQKLGFNMVRKHTKVEPQRWYHMCDKMGLLVWQDMPSPIAKEPGEWQKQFEVEMKALVEQHFNSPSIIMWVPFNEGWGQDGPYNKEGTQRITKWVKEMDPSRIVNNTSGWTDSGAGDVHDIHAYPGPAAPPIEKQRAIVLGEFGGLGLPVEGHTWEQKGKNWGYQNMASKEELTDKYVRLLGRLWQLHDENGLCAGVYTQTTDVETEVNGFLTYDREVIKLDESRAREANLGKGPRVDIVPIVKTAADEPADWQYTFDKPADGWQKADFDAKAWKTGKSGFGTKETPNAIVNTVWSTPDIWLRREIDLSEDALKDAQLLLHHDDSCEIYINGVMVRKLNHFTGGYVEQQMNEQGKTALKAGKNLIAVHCHQVGGGQYIDVGLARLVEKKRN